MNIPLELFACPLYFFVILRSSDFPFSAIHYIFLDASLCPVLCNTLTPFLGMLLRHFSYSFFFGLLLRYSSSFSPLLVFSSNSLVLFTSSLSFFVTLRSYCIVYFFTDSVFLVFTLLFVQHPSSLSLFILFLVSSFSLYPSLSFHLSCFDPVVIHIFHFFLFCLTLLTLLLVGHPMPVCPYSSVSVLVSSLIHSYTWLTFLSYIDAVCFCFFHSLNSFHFPLLFAQHLTPIIWIFFCNICGFYNLHIASYMTHWSCL